jgi:hypothetical protein
MMRCIVKERRNEGDCNILHVFIDAFKKNYLKHFNFQKTGRFQHALTQDSNF